MKALKELLNIVAATDDPEKLEKFFLEILTPKELEDIGLRWQIVKELYWGETQRKIAERNSASLCKITRGSKILKQKHSTTLQILNENYPQNGK